MTQGGSGASTVTVRYVVVDGADGEALARCQAAAIRQALTWLAARPDVVEPDDAETTYERRLRQRPEEDGGQGAP